MTGKRFLGISTILMIGLVLTLLFGGAWVTAAAAQGALPGDALYSVKTGLETARTSLSRDAAADAGLHLAYAETRLDEMAALIESGRYEGLKEAAANFDFHVSAAIRSLALVAKDDPAQATELALSVSAALARDTELLAGLMATVPAESVDVLENALQASQQAQMTSDFEFTGTVEAIQDGVWTISGQEVVVTADSEIGQGITVGDLVKVEGLVSIDGALIAREIGLSMDGIGEEDGNLNDNDDGNLNDNDDGNLNDNDDGNLNDNDDGNLNDNDDGNLNDNDDGNLNDNDDGNLNDNDDGNLNDNDDGNLNDNGTLQNNDNGGINNNSGITNDGGLHDDDNSGGGGGDNDNGGGRD